MPDTKNVADNAALARVSAILNAAKTLEGLRDALVDERDNIGSEPFATLALRLLSEANVDAEAFFSALVRSTLVRLLESNAIERKAIQACLDVIPQPKT